MFTLLNTLTADLSSSQNKKLKIKVLPRCPFGSCLKAGQTVGIVPLGLKICRSRITGKLSIKLGFIKRVHLLINVFIHLSTHLLLTVSSGMPAQKTGRAESIKLPFKYD